MKNIITLLAVLCSILSYSQFNSATLLCNTVVDNQSIHPMDFDGDGDMDVIVTDGNVTEYRPSTYTAQNFGVCENQGNSVFVYHSLVSMSNQVFWAFGDMDGDGWLDFAWAEMWSLNADSYQLNWRLNNGDYTFGPDQTIYTLPYDDPNDGFEFQFEQIGIGDIDNDGTNEVLAALNGIPFDTDTYTQAPWSNIYVFDYDGGIFSGPAWICETHGSAGPNGAPMLDLYVKDYDLDGMNDIMSQWYIGDGNNLTVVYAISDGVFADEPTFLTDQYNYDFGDFNGDGGSMIVTGYPNFSFLTAGNILASYVSTNQEAPGIALLDADMDGDGDIVIPTVNGHIYYFEHDATWPMAQENGPWQPLLPSYELINMNVPNDVATMTRLDFDGDADDDLLFMAGGNLYVAENAGTPVATTDVVISAFFDENMNGTQDANEADFPFFSAFLDISGAANPDLLFSNSLSADIQVSLFPETYTIELNENFQWYDLTTPAIVELDLTTPLTTQSIKFGMALNGPPTYSISSSLNSNDGICGGTINHYISLYNSGNIEAQGTVTYTFDEVHTYLNASPAPASITGNTVTWNYTELFPFENLLLLVSLISPQVVDIGAYATNTAVVDILDTENNLVSSETLIDSYEVTCAYDPNDITEHNGYTDAGYILDGDELEYTIRFQNTGNAPAQDVRIENQLSELLDWSTMQPVVWSHDFDLMIDETGRAIFTFDGINLPDSVNNEAASHGFVTYRIHPVAGLDALTEIENTAEIFFDLNPAVVTNTEVNTIFECSMMTGNALMEVAGCTGNSETLQNEITYAENYMWWLDDEVISTTSAAEIELNEVGSFIITQQASNPLCEVEYVTSLIVGQTPGTPGITQNGNTLNASGSGTFFWSLDGNLLEGETNNTLEMTESGNYSVFVVSDGCASEAASGDFVFSSVGEMDEGIFIVYPNPATDFITISITTDLIGSEIVISDMMGREVMNAGKTTNTAITLDCSVLATGSYLLRISDKVVKCEIE